MSGFLGELMNSGALAAMPGLLTQIVGTAQGAAGGGLPALLQQFENAGLAEHVSSWLGSGENLPLTAEHVIAAVPPEQLEAWAARVGIPTEQLAPILAEVLPHAIDHATPDGAVPTEGTPTPDIASVIGRLFSR